MVAIEERKCLIGRQIKDVMHRSIAVADFQDLGTKSSAAAFFTNGFDVCQKLHCDRHDASPFAHRASSAGRRVEAEHGSRIISLAGFVSFRE